MATPSPSAMPPPPPPRAFGTLALYSIYFGGGMLAVLDRRSRMHELRRVLAGPTGVLLPRTPPPGPTPSPCPARSAVCPTSKCAWSVGGMIDWGWGRVTMGASAVGLPCLRGTWF